MNDTISKMIDLDWFWNYFAPGILINGYLVFDFQSSSKQIEILGLCISDQLKKPVRTFDLAEYFHVEELTIKKRSSGFTGLWYRYPLK